MSTPGAALRARASGPHHRYGNEPPQSIIKPGASLIRAAQPLSDPRRAEGRFPSQWLWPGPNSRMACPNTAASVPIPPIVVPGTPVSAVIASYEVPDGYRFVLTDVLMQANNVLLGGSWIPGSGSLLFTVQVVFSTGPRNVEFLSNLPFGMGSMERPWPLRGRLEFGPLEVVEILVTNVALNAPNPNDFAFGALNGFTYPNTEASNS